MVLEALSRLPADYAGSGERLDAPETLPAEQFYKAEADRVGVMHSIAEDLPRRYPYAQGQELVDLLGERAASAGAATATERINRQRVTSSGKRERASWILSDCFTSARRFLDTDPRTGQHTDHDPGLIATLPLDSPLTAPVLAELKDTLLVEDSVDTGERDQYQTGLRDIYIRFEPYRDREGRQYEQVILERAKSTEQHEAYLAKFSGIYPHETVLASPRPASLELTRPQPAARGYAPRHSRTPAETVPQGSVPHTPAEPSTRLSPWHHDVQWPEDTRTDLHRADAQNVPARANSAPAAERTAAVSRLAAVVANTPRPAGGSLEMEVLRQRTKQLDTELNRLAGHGPDPELERRVRGNLEHAVGAVAAMFAAALHGGNPPRYAQLLSVSSSPGFDPTKRLDAATEATKAELERLFGVPAETKRLEPGSPRPQIHYTGGKDRTVYQKPAKHFPGFNLSYHYVRSRNGHHTQFVIMLGRSTA